MLGQSRDASLVIGPMMVVPLEVPFGVSGQAPLSSQNTLVPSTLFHDFLCLTMRHGKTKLPKSYSSSSALAFRV